MLNKKLIAMLLVLCMALPIFAAAEVIPSTSNVAVREQLKPVSYWNENLMTNLPNPFEMLNGEIVKTPEEWEIRAAELRELIQYYEYGYKPAAPDALAFSQKTLKYNAFDWATWTFSEKEIDGIAIEITVGEKTATMSAGVQLPTTPMPEGGYPAVIWLGSLAGANAADYNARGYAVIGLDVNEIYKESDGTGIVKTLYEVDWLNDPNAPSSMMGWAWGASRLIDALEQGAYAGQINPKMLAIGGTSRNGKGALVAGAFDERIAVVVPANAGCGGTAIERFVSPLLYPEYYIYTSGEDTYNSHIVLPSQEGAVGVRKWVLSEGSADAWNEEEQRYVPRYQTLSHCREQQDLWFCSRFQQFMQDESIICDPVDIHKWTTQDEFVNPMEWEDGYDGPGYGGKGTPFGVMNTLPFDQHYLMSLVAPRGLFITSGFTDDWNAPEGMAFGYYVTRETYRYFDVINGTEGVYEPMINFITGDWGHTFTTYGVNALIDFCNTVMQPEGEIYAQKAVYTGYPYPAEDPRRVADYDKMNWSAAQPEVALISIAVEGENTLAVGGSTALKAVYTPDNATGIHAKAATWTTSDPAIATVDAAGVVTAMAAGAVTVTVTFNGVTAEFPITIN